MYLFFLNVLTRGSVSYSMFEQKMKFFGKELHVGILKVQPPKKRKRSDSHEVATEKARVEAIEEWMEFVPPTSPVIPTLMLVYLFGITETSPEVRVEVSNQPIEVGVDAKLEVKVSGLSIKEGEVVSNGEAKADDRPIEEVPIPSQGSTNIFSMAELTPKIEEM